MFTYLLIVTALLLPFAAIKVSAQDTIKCGSKDLVNSPNGKFTGAPYIKAKLILPNIWDIVISDAWNATSDGSQCISVCIVSHDTRLLIF
jgi:hypothetical protein